MAWGGRKNGVKGGIGDGSPGVAVVVKSNPRFLDENNVGYLVCEVEDYYYYYSSFYACSL